MQTLELRSTLSSGSRVLSFRSLSKLHLHCLLRCRAQFLEVNAKAQKPTQICFFYYTRRRRQLSGRRSVAVGAVVNFGKFVRKLFIHWLQGQRYVPHRDKQTHTHTHVHRVWLWAFWSTTFVRSVAQVPFEIRSWLDCRPEREKCGTYATLFYMQNGSSGLVLVAALLVRWAVVSNSCSVLTLWAVDCILLCGWYSLPLPLLLRLRLRNSILGFLS